MALAPGTRLGVFEITAQIGEGGMGQVYRARDTKLNRDVALKVLPESVANDSDRLARFTREAQTLASLNHPNIAHLYGLEGPAFAPDGASAGKQAGPFLVMELLEGEDLSQRLARGAIPLEEALPIARQIAEALEAAHDLDIVHRDLKPANIKIRRDGTVKVLDFGLAKALSADAAGQSGASFANSPTVASPARTAAGIILGTAAYMSPEQARGQFVDKRADIWAFGCVVYEMLSGVGTFSGDTTTDILAAVIQRDPDWTKLPGAVPARITSLLRRCLQRNPKDRLRDIADARFEIEDALRPADTRPAAPPITTQARRRSYVAPALALIVGAATTAAVFLLSSTSQDPGTAPAPTIRSVVSLPPDTALTLDRGSAVSLSPNGHRLVYSATSKGKAQLYVRSLDRFESLPVAGTDGAMHPFFSPDGQWVGFFADGKLKKVSLDGGAPVALGDARAPRGEAWGPDNTILMTPFNASPIVKVPAIGGQPVPISALIEGELGHRWPRYLPDGKSVIFSIWNDTGWEPSRVAVQPVGSQEHKVIVGAGGGYARVIKDEGDAAFLIYARAEGLMAAKFDTAKLEVTGSPVPVVDGVITNLSGGAHYDVSANGTLAYLPGATPEEDRDFVWVSTDGKTRTPVIRVHNMGRFFSLSPDGTRIVRASTGNAGRDIWIDDLSRGTNTRITSEQNNFSGIWSPDGKWVGFSRGVPIRNLYRRTVDGSDVEQRLTQHPLDQEAESFSSDGVFLSYSEQDPVTGLDLWVMTLPAPGAPPGTANARPFVKTRFAEGNSHFSPDGKWLVYDSNESGRFEVYVRAFPEGLRKWAVSTEGGIIPTWSPTGREIFYRSTSGMIMAVPVETTPEFKVGTPRVLFDARSYDNQYGVSPDAKRILLMPLLAPEAAPTHINLVLNWLEELRQRVK